MAIQGFRCHDNFFHLCLDKGDIIECTELIDGLSEHTVRQLVKQGKVKSVRTGEGRNGKILVNKADLIAYFNGKGV